ncbi:MAG: tRNA1(Val) (adenine(37)-N6)-methyltransferase [Janthinobacterium lividum]
MTLLSHTSPSQDLSSQGGLSQGLVSQGTLLNQRLRYAQPVEGYRTGLEPVLLAACIPARPGQSVLEAGTGAGAGLLCLLARVPGLTATGVELDPAMAELARTNLASNGQTAMIHADDVVHAGRFGPVDHAFANPPWHDPAGTLPAHPAAARAKHLAATGLSAWIIGLSGCLARSGTLSLALPVSLLGESLAILLQAGLGRTVICPLWPRPDVEAKLALLQARRGRGGSRLLPGLVLHEGRGFTAAAEAILRGGAALPLHGAHRRETPAPGEG